MSTNLRFEHPKHPNDKAWYGIPFDGVVLTTVDGVTIKDIGPVDFSQIGKFHTPGDTLTETQTLLATQLQVSTDGSAAMMWLEFGKPQREYAIEVAVTLADGVTKLFRSAVLPVTGL